MKTILTISAILLVSCGNTVAPPTYPAVKQSVSIPSGYAYVFELDGHKFVAATIGYSKGGISIIHHPGCTCLDKKP